MTRSVLALAAGLLTMVATVVFVTWAVVALMFDDPAAPPTGVYLGVNLVYSMVAAVVGGYVTGAVAGRAPLSHAAALAVGVFTFGFLGLMRGGPAPGQPGWYPYVLTLIAPAGLILGGWLRGRRASARRAS